MHSDPPFDGTFVRVAGCCWMLTSLTTLGLIFDAVSDGLFFFLVLAFVVADVFYCAATWSGSPLQRVVAVFFALAAGLGILSFATRFGGGIVPTGAMDLAYPLIQPAGRLLTGFWLWQSARSLAGSGSANVMRSAAT